MDGKFIFVNCTLWRGAFSAERVFELQQADGAEYVGIAPLHYCVAADNEHVLTREEPPIGQSMRGKLAARLIEREDDKVRISVPDGECVSVSVELVSRRSPPRQPHVFVRS